VVDLFIKTNKPIGSNTLKANGFDCFSSATIRNYFVKLEKIGYLHRPHSSGGRIPTSSAYREYANNCLENLKISEKDEKKLSKNLKKDCKKLNTYLFHVSDQLSEMTNSCVFLLSPTFDQDFIQEIKLISLENNLLCIIITNYGQIKTELFQLNNLKKEEIKQIENFLLWKIGKEKRQKISIKISKFARKIYKEMMMRFITSYSRTNINEKSYKTGFSNLLSYREFQDPITLAQSISLFEDFDKISALLNESIKVGKLTCWIGNELSAFGSLATECAVITIPYRINYMPAGAIAVLLPKRCSYQKVFGIMQIFSECISDTLTKNIYKYKINFHSNEEILLEDKRKKFR